jgi:hypothetical protein
VSKFDALQTTLNYCKETLSNNEAADNYKEGIELKGKVLNIKLSQTDGSFEINKETFDNVVSKFKKSGKRSYDFLVKASPKFQDAVYQFCQEMVKEEIFPKTFSETILHQIYKGKGRREILPNNRFIHSKQWLPRVAEGCIVAQGLKGPILEGSSMYQIGGQPGHRPEELMFVVKSIIAKQRLEGKAIIIQCQDISKFFDKEMMQDAILTCYARKANPKAIRLWYKLNEATQIRVKSSQGLSDSADVGAVVGQGTIGGALVSQAVLDDGIMEHFEPGGRDELNYGSVPMAPAMFQDDLIHLSGGTREARAASSKVAAVLAQRNLRLNEDKSVSMVIGSRKQKESIRAELEARPLMCGQVVMTLVEEDKWLGQQLSGGGLGQSVAATVAAREGRVRGACLEIADIVEDWRAEAVGGMETALMLWEACCVPSLLHGAGTWVEISTATEKKLNALQHWFVRLMLRVGPGAPTASLCWDTGLMDMGLRIWKEKLLLVLSIRSLGEETLARKIYEEQKARLWPGLAKETHLICKELGIEDANVTSMKKMEFKKAIDQACKAEQRRRLLKQAEGRVKCKKITTESFGKKEYISNIKLKDVRQRFMTRFGLQPFAGNFSHDKRFAKSQWLCRCREAREEEGHLLSGSCRVYGDIRASYGDLREDGDLVDFFREILERRKELEEEERTQVG